MPLLRAHALTRTYRTGNQEIHAVREVDLKVQAGEMVALVGPSGSGKSTLLYLLGGLEQPSAGSVSLEGQDYASLSEEALTVLRRRRIGYIFQQFNLVPGQTAAENVALPALLDGRRPSPAQVEEALAAVGAQADRIVHLCDGRVVGEEDLTRGKGGVGAGGAVPLTVPAWLVLVSLAVGVAVTVLAALRPVLAGTRQTALAARRESFAPGAPPQPGPPARSRFPGPGQGRTPFPQSAPPKRFIRKVPGM